MNIKPVFFTIFIAFTLGGFVAATPAQAISMPEQSRLEDAHTSEVEETPITLAAPLAPLQKTIAPNVEVQKSNPYAIIEAAKHAERSYRVRIPSYDVQQIRKRLDMAIVETKTRIPKIREIDLSPVERLRDRLTQLQQAAKIKISSLLEQIGSKANSTAEQLRESS